MRIPPIDLARVRRRIATDLDARWGRILADGAYVLGPEVAAFEEAFTRFLGAGGCVAVGNGTDALILALRALGVGPGDEVILPAFSFFATAEAVILLGGKPVFADVEAATLNLDPADAAARITPATVGILGVHLYGRPFDVPAVTRLARERGLWLVEDAAQAHGARWGEARVGTSGELAAWSFYPTKNLGCFGDGGAVTGGDPELLARVRRLANHGQEGRYHHVEVGTNSRLDSLQAAVLNCRLPSLDGDNARRREIADRYRGMLAGVGDLELLADPPGALPVYHQYTVRTARRDELAEHLRGEGIGAMVHYPSPLHRQPALAGAGEPPALPVAEAAARRVLCLPVFPELTDDEVEQVAEAVRRFYA